MNKLIRIDLQYQLHWVNSSWLTCELTVLVNSYFSLQFFKFGLLFTWKNLKAFEIHNEDIWTGQPLNWTRKYFLKKKKLVWLSKMKKNMKTGNVFKFNKFAPKSAKYPARRWNPSTVLNQRTAFLAGFNFRIFPNASFFLYQIQPYFPEFFLLLFLC